VSRSRGKPRAIIRSRVMAFFFGFKVQGSEARP
jgi:hypothetical protein